MVEASPLQWPQGRPRRTARRSAAFGKKVSNGTWATKQSLSVYEAMRRLQSELDRLGAHDYVLSSNLRLRLDGLPRSDQGEPADPGVALYFVLGGKPHAMPCDTYDRVADNIAAIAKHIEATRAIERYGVSTVAEMFTGFVALPPPKSPWETLGLTPGLHSTGDVEAAHRRLALRYHPDRPDGDPNRMAEINAARDAALKELGE